MSWSSTKQGVTDEAEDSVRPEMNAEDLLTGTQQQLLTFPGRAGIIDHPFPAGE